MATETSTALQPLEAELDHADLRAKAAAVASPEREIDISFFLHRNRKSTRLIGNESDDNWITARKDWLSFDFQKSIFVTRIDVYASGYEEYHEMELSYIESFDQSTIVEKRKFNGESFRFAPRRFTTGFGLNPDRPLFRSAQVTSISVYGIEQEKFTDAVNVLFDIERVRESVEARLDQHLEQARSADERAARLNKAISDQQEEIEEKKKQIEDLEITGEALLARQQEIENSANRTQALLKESSERRVALDNSISEREKILKELNDERHKANQELKNIKDNINLFPTEIAGFVRQGTHHIRVYLAIMAVPIVIIAFVTYRLFANAESLLNFYDISGTVNIFEFLVSRLPYVIVSATILAICFAIGRVLISEIISINRRRQELHKISIIASDVAYASQDALDIDEITLYELRTQTKMELLKEHLRMNIGQDFEYAPGAGYRRRVQDQRKVEPAATAAPE